MPRRLVGELMDDPALDAATHAHALRGLARINAISGTAGQVYRELRRQVKECDRPLRVLDVATGSGDLPIALLRRARRDGVRLECTGCDVSQTALDQAKRRAGKAGLHLDTVRLDALHDPLPRADVVTCALFLHHLPDEQVHILLEKMTGAAEVLVVVSDLRRGPWGTLLAASVPRLLTRSPIVHVDALRSARAALSLGEARAMTRGIAGGQGWRIRPAFPARMLMTWPRPTTTPSSSAQAPPAAWRR